MVKGKKIKQLITAVTLQLVLLINCSPTEPNGDNGNGIDTTSQNFTFETYEFGDGFNSSYFRDVWVFDENNIWAVGEVSLPDGFTNIMRWSGEKWYAQKPWFTSSGFSGIWALDSSNIYFASGAVRKYEQGNFIEFDLGHLGFSNGQAVHKLWGSSESNIWGVGPWGTVVHYNGVEWTKIEFDTQWYFYGITGNKASGIAYAVARNANHNTIIVELNNLSTEIIYNNIQTEGSPGSWDITLAGNNELYLADIRVWSFNIETKSHKIQFDLPSGTGILSITSYNKNDIYFIGRRIGGIGNLTHYNGQRYQVFEMPFASDTYGGSSASKNTAAYAGFTNDRATITLIRRTK